jgi:glutathione S-transferase
MVAKLEGLDAQAPEGFFGGERPVMADFFAAEGLQALHHLLGASRAEAIGQRLPRLTSLSHRIDDRPAIMRVQRPDRFTARPDEPAVLERLRSLTWVGL